MAVEIRKAVDFIEEIFIEGERATPHPLKVFASALVLRNPWAGRGFVEDLKPEIHALSSELGRMLTSRMLAIAGGGGKKLCGLHGWPRAGELSHRGSIDAQARLRLSIPLPDGTLFNSGCTQSGRGDRRARRRHGRKAASSDR